MKPEMATCKLCDLELQSEACRQLESPFVWQIRCPRCGVYRVSQIVWRSNVRAETRSHRYLLSAVSRQRFENDGEPLVITEDILERPESVLATVSGLAPMTPVQRAEHLLRVLGRNSQFPGDEVRLDPKMDYPLAFASSPQEMQLYLGHLAERKWTKQRSEMGSSQSWSTVTFEGWAKIEESPEEVSAPQAFVAMWFAPEMESVFDEAIVPLEETTGWRFLRVDRRQYNDKICDQIVVEIRRSRFVVADVTGHRQGVCFEAGYALGLGIPVIWTCRSDDIESAHFDTRQYNHIVWDSAADLKSKLEARVLATIGRLSKPIQTMQTAALGTAAGRQGR